MLIPLFKGISVFETFGSVKILLGKKIVEKTSGFEVSDGAVVELGSSSYSQYAV